MHLHRRHILNTSMLAATFLAGCGVITAKNGTVTVNLANAQLQAKSIYAALGAFVTELANSVPAATKAEVNAAYAELGKFVAIFANIQNGSSNLAQATQSVINTAQTLVALLPLPTVTRNAIGTGLLLISPLLTGVSSITAPVSAALHSGIGTVPVIPGPIPIPLS